jgi:hypothetical protein
LLKQGHADDALAYFQRALAFAEKRLPPNHPTLICSLFGAAAEAWLALHR